MLTVLFRDGNIGKKVAWACRCDCGQYTRSTTSNLTAGFSQSCGCVRTKHSGKGTRLYRIWTGMKDRCLNPVSKYRKNYGGRGITVCVEWAESFAAFQSWALSNGYADNLEIDRTDVNGNYCPENCRWISSLENSRNRRCSKLDRDKVSVIRLRIEQGFNNSALAKYYRVSTGTISAIRMNKIWKDVQPC